MKKKLAIISSYSEACGNASYTEVLRKEFSKYYDVDILRLQLDLLQSMSRKAEALAEKHIDDICKQVKNYDYVNIQFEAGLYGSSREQIVSRVRRIIRSCDNLIFTMHRVDIPKSILDRENLNYIFGGGMHWFSRMKRVRQGMYLPEMYKILAREVEAINKGKGQGLILVHTPRDQKNIELFFDCKHVMNFPLTFLNEEERSRVRKKEDRDRLLERYSLDEDTKVIGLFGFVSDYKGHETAIRSLKYLPEEYKAIIFGSQHPSSIAHFKHIDEYLEKLIDLIDDLEIEDRVIFAGSLDDEAFINALYAVDFAVLPYLEVNQSGSGIASLALETRVPALFSNNKAFYELQKYYKNTFDIFDIGNSKELADKLVHYRPVYEENLKKSLEVYNIENNIKKQIEFFEGK